MESLNIDWAQKQEKLPDPSNKLTYWKSYVKGLMKSIWSMIKQKHREKLIKGNIDGKIENINR